MARLPPAHHGRLPPQRGGVLVRLAQRGGVLVRLPLALGRGAVDALVHFPLRLLCRLLRRARRGSVAARMARRSWRDDARPPAEPLLRRAVAHAGAAVLPAVLLCQRIQRAVVRFLLGIPGFLRRIVPSGPCPPPPPRAAPPPPPPPPPPRNSSASLYGGPPKKKRTPPSSSPSSGQSSSTPEPEPEREPVIVDGQLVPDELVKQYSNYCRASVVCPAKWSICHLCFFEIQKAERFAVRTDMVLLHCNEHHADKGPFVRCGEAGCKVRVRAGRDQALHTYFCHTRSAGWWDQRSHV